jgi:hypothetical protein
MFRHSPRAKDLKDALPLYKADSPTSIIHFARAVQAKYDDPSVDDGEIQLVLNAKFAEAGVKEWDWLQQWLAEPASTRKSFLFAFQQKFLPEQTQHEVTTKLHSIRPDKSWDARRLVSEIIGLIRPLGYCITDDQHRIQLENAMVNRFFEWAGPYLQDKVTRVVEPFDLDDVAAILDVMKAHQPNVMLSLQPTISAGGSHVCTIGATLTDDKGFILTMDDVQRFAQANRPGTPTGDAKSNTSPIGENSPNRGSFSRGSFPKRGSSNERAPSADRKSSDDRRRGDLKSRSYDNKRGPIPARREDFTKSGFRKDDRTARLPFKDNKGRENYKPRPQFRMQQSKPTTRCPWCHGQRHNLDKCISYARIVLKQSVPTKYVCYVCREVGQHLGRFCPVNRPELKDMATMKLCARCSKPGHFSMDCPEPEWLEPDKALLDELDKRFNSEANLVNVFTGSLVVGDAESGEEERLDGEENSQENEPVNLAHYRDDDDPDSDPGND